ncbi:hypothetical protein [Maricaulis sp.]|uniref:hypothetical protein n=1 Tax=Maricaulis sp. TaxID=1486257 RepID=UPI0025E980DE|nr:hypothetical protein [Maricaulis sp.]MDF1769008.1 hypothetical protein [Maricaulis sp.]
MTKTLALATTALALLTAACQADDFVHAAENDHVGRILYYERTNQDGSLDERITVYRASPTSLEVYKEAALCGNAALVTAELDLDTFSAHQLIGGRLLPEAEVMQFAFIEQNEAGDRMDMVVRLPDMEIRNEFEIASSHWHLFDFDLASLTAVTPYLANPDEGFGFGMALLWADPSAEDPLVWMGDVTASPTGLDNGEYSYALSGSALTGDRSTGPDGTLRIHADDGYITYAAFPVPNHPGYTDFELNLLRVSDGGAEEWDALLRAHWADCGN